MDKLYVLMYTDLAISDFRIFNKFNDALIEYLKSSVFETRKLLTEEIEDDEDDEDINPQCIIDEIDDEDDENDEDEDNNEDEDEDEGCDDDYETCVLQIYEIDAETSEFKPTKEFDVDYFQDLIGENENLIDYLNNLEEKLNSNEIPSEISKAYEL